MKALRWMFAALAVGFLMFSGGAAQAQSTVRPCWYNSAGACVWTGTDNPLPVTIIGGGGGGLSVTDGATFTASSSNFTPGGGEYAASPTTCADGKQCTFAITTQRALTIDTPTSNNALYSAITAAIPVNVSSTPTAVTGHTVSSNTGIDINTQMVNGVAVLAGTGAVGTGAQRIAVGTDAATIAGSAPGTAGSASTNVLSVQGIASMTPLLVTQSANADPCSSSVAKSTVAFSSSSGGPVSIVALSGSTKVYVCAVAALTDTAVKLSFIDGTGGSCASAQHALAGSTTAANGMSLPATGGFTLGSGNGTVMVTAAASALCFLQSGTSLVAGTVSYVQQ